MAVDMVKKVRRVNEVKRVDGEDGFMNGW